MVKLSIKRRKTQGFTQPAAYTNVFENGSGILDFFVANDI